MNPLCYYMMELIRVWEQQPADYDSPLINQMKGGQADCGPSLS